MKYTSTRDPSISVTFEEALCSGYAPGGGLFVPQNFPERISKDTLLEWSKLKFPQLAQCIIRRFISQAEISDAELEKICIQSFVIDNDSPETIPIRRVGRAFVVELFHGPTFCFKDFGMRPVIFLLAHFASKKRKGISLIVSTTGDTGPAAVKAVGDANNPFLNILVHYPHGQISEFQRRQMTTVRSPCVRIASFQGGGDDMDLPIKNIQGEMKGVCGVNSYNIGRPLMQMVHFIWTYLRVADEMDIEVGDPARPIDIILPTGAMGNMAAGYMAKRLLPPGILGKLCAGVNINDITHRAFGKGEFHKSPRLEKTLSEAINIQVPYNFERLLYYLTGENHTLVKQWMTTMDRTQKLDLPTKWLEELQSHFGSARITDEEMCDTMRYVYENFQYYIDPHSAVAFAAAQRLGYPLGNDDDDGLDDGDRNEDESPHGGGSGVNNIYAILSTASPCKFQEAVTIAMGEECWSKYRNSQLFPSAVREVMDLQERDPLSYDWPAGLSLTETQAVWEQTAKRIVQDEFCHEKE